MGLAHLIMYLGMIFMMIGILEFVVIYWCNGPDRFITESVDGLVTTWVVTIAVFESITSHLSWHGLIIVLLLCLCLLFNIVACFHYF